MVIRFIDLDLEILIYEVVQSEVELNEQYGGGERPQALRSRLMKEEFWDS